MFPFSFIKRIQVGLFYVVSPSLSFRYAVVKEFCVTRRRRRKKKKEEKRRKKKKEERRQNSAKLRIDERFSSSENKLRSIQK